MAGPAGAWAVVGSGTSSAPAGTSQAAAQSAYQTALTAQINPYAGSIADASATSVVNFYQRRINSPGNDTIYVFTMGGTAFSVAANVNSTTQVTDQDSSQSITQNAYETIVQAAMQAAGQPAT
jgi:hypothetical protein